MKIGTHSIEMFEYQQSGIYNKRKWQNTKVKRSHLKTIATAKSIIRNRLIYILLFIIVLIAYQIKIVNTLGAFACISIGLSVISFAKFILSILKMDFKFVRDLEAEEDMR